MNTTNWRNNVPVQERTLLWQRLLSMLNRFPTSSDGDQVMILARNFEEKVWNRASSKEEYTKLMMTKIKKIADELAKQNIDKNNLAKTQAPQLSSSAAPQPLPTHTPAPPPQFQPPLTLPIQNVSTPTMLQISPPSSSQPIPQTNSSISNQVPTHPDPSLSTPPAFPLSSMTPQFSSQTNSQPQSLSQTQAFSQLQAQSKLQSLPLIQQQAGMQQQQQQQQVPATANQPPLAQYSYGVHPHRLQAHEPGYHALQARAVLAQQQQYLLQQQLLQRQLQSSNQQLPPNFNQLASTLPLQQPTSSPASLYPLDPTAISSLSSTTPTIPTNPTPTPGTNAYPFGPLLPNNHLMLYRNSLSPPPPPLTAGQSTTALTPTLPSAQDPSLLTTMQAPHSNLLSISNPTASVPSAVNSTFTTPQPSPQLSTKKIKAPKPPKTKPAPSTSQPPPPPSPAPAPLPPPPLLAPAPPLASTIPAVTTSSTPVSNVQSIPKMAQPQQQPQPSTSTDTSPPSEPKKSTPSPQITTPAEAKRSGPPSILSSRIQYSEKPLSPEDIPKMSKKTQEAFAVYQEFNKTLLKLASTPVITEAMRKAAHQKREATYARLRKHFELMQQKMVLMNFEQLATFIAEMQKSTAGISAMLRRYEASQLANQKAKGAEPNIPNASVPSTPSSVLASTSPPPPAPASVLPAPSATLPTTDSTTPASLEPPSSAVKSVTAPAAPPKVTKPTILQHRLPKRLREQREKELSKLAQSMSAVPETVSPAGSPPRSSSPSTITSPSPCAATTLEASPFPPLPEMDPSGSAGFTNLMRQWDYLTTHVDAAVQSVLLKSCFGGQQDFLNGPQWIQWAFVHEVSSNVQDDGQDIEQREFVYLKELEQAKKKLKLEVVEEPSELDLFGIYSA